MRVKIEAGLIKDECAQIAVRLKVQLKDTIGKMRVTIGKPRHTVNT